jgi:hypothetical protein
LLSATRARIANTDWAGGATCWYSLDGVAVGVVMVSIGDVVIVLRIWWKGVATITWHTLNNKFVILRCVYTTDVRFD